MGKVSLVLDVAKVLVRRKSSSQVNRPWIKPNKDMCFALIRENESKAVEQESKKEISDDVVESTGF